MAEQFELEQLAERIYFRTRNTVAWAKLDTGNDDDEMQHHQLELYDTEVRSGVQRMQEHGLTTMPLPGSHGLVLHHGGQRSMGMIVATDDPRYRPRGLKPGETHGYMIDEADKKGENGKVRSLWKGALGWAHSIFGKTINMGSADTTTINIGKDGSVTINLGSNAATVNFTAGNGDITVNGVSLVNHTHSGVVPGAGHTGPPDH